MSSEHWYVSAYDRESERLLFSERLKDVDDDEVRGTFGAASDAIGGFEVETSEQREFIRRTANRDLDDPSTIAFVELLRDE